MACARRVNTSDRQRNKIITGLTIPKEDSSPDDKKKNTNKDSIKKVDISLEDCDLKTILHQKF